MWIERKLSDKIEKTRNSRLILLLSGARQTGKSSLLKRLYPNAEYVTLDRVLIAAEAETNPSAFLKQFSSTVIIDEVQYAPSLFRELKIRVDEDRDQYGRWILTGSQKFSLMKNISESLAGRIGILHLHTLSAQELRVQGIPKEEIEKSLWVGGYPEIWANPSIDRDMFYADYIQTYLERDLKAIINVKDLREFQRFITICAGRVGQILNYNGIANDLGVSAVTVKSWLSALEASGIISLLPPYYANVGKRLIKSPMLYFCDTGLLSHLLNINNKRSYDKSIHKGTVWENFTFCELMKTSDAVPGRNLFFYRDQNGVEIDFVIEKGEILHLCEAKAAERVDDRKLNFNKVAKLFKGQRVECTLSCRSEEERVITLPDYTICNPLHHTLLDYK